VLQYSPIEDVLERIDKLTVPVFLSDAQGAVAVSILECRVGAVLEWESDGIPPVALSRQHQRVLAGTVTIIGVGAVIQEYIDGLRMSLRCRLIRLDYARSGAVLNLVNALRALVISAALPGDIRGRHFVIAISNSRLKCS
jgi:hypothetical protein